jgi:hypothetical protein
MRCIWFPRRPLGSSPWRLCRLWKHDIISRRGRHRAHIRLLPNTPVVGTGYLHLLFSTLHLNLQAPNKGVFWFCRSSGVHECHHRAARHVHVGRNYFGAMVDDRAEHARRSRHPIGCDLSVCSRWLTGNEQCTYCRRKAHEHIHWCHLRSSSATRSVGTSGDIGKRWRPIAHRS